MEAIVRLNEKLQIKISGETHSRFLSFFAQYPQLKGTKITLLAVILYYSTLSGTNRQILTPKRYDEHHRHFYRGVPPGSIHRLEDHGLQARDKLSFKTSFLLDEMKI